MKVLVVEDSPSFLSGIRDQLKAIPGILPPLEALSRDSARRIIESEELDAIVCDLKIPSSDGLLDAHTDHGLAVCNYASSTKSGTPLLILSGFGTLDIVAQLLRTVQTGDVFGNGHAIPMAEFFRKDDLPNFVTRMREFNSEISTLEDIEIVPDNLSRLLSHHEKRIIRVFARRVGAVLVEVSEIGTGMSGTRTLKLLAIDGNGQPCARVIAKIGSITTIDDERERYDRHVVTVLSAGDYAPKVQEVTAGAGDLGAIIYRLADGYDRTLFQLLEENEPGALTTMAALKSVLDPWVTGAILREVEIRDIRRARIDDQRFETVKYLLNGIDFEAFEARKVYVRGCRQHGDLHGLNALVNAKFKPMLIDYGEVGHGCPSLDPLTLELSLIFHPDGAAIRGDWPSDEEAKAWFDLDSYVETCPVADYVNACRAWALEGSTPREVLANAYAYLVRQLQYSDTDHSLAITLIRGIIQAFE